MYDSLRVFQRLANYPERERERDRLADIQCDSGGRVNIFESDCICYRGENRSYEHVSI